MARNREQVGRSNLKEERGQDRAYLVENSQVFACQWSANEGSSRRPRVDPSDMSNSICLNEIPISS